MASWRKLLARMVADPDPRSYTYDEAAGILGQLGFAPPKKKKRGGSHRKFRLEVDDPSAEHGKRGVIIGLVDSGSGTLKPVYIIQMVSTLRANDLLPKG